MLPWSPLSLIAVIKKNSSAESQSLANGETSEILQGSATGFNE
jgi:hypothetical protein